jgi:two-component system, cell cycle sensor histidine kinase DivJ
MAVSGGQPYCAATSGSGRELALADNENLPDRSRDAIARRHFLRTQSIKGGLGIVLSLAYIIIIGGPDVVELIAFAGFVAPLALSLAARAPIPLWRLEAASLVLFAVLIALLSVLTSGLSSPFIFWLVLVPFEGALAGRGRAVMFSGATAVLALAAIIVVQMTGLMPPSRLPPPLELWLCVSLVVAIIQASLMAIAAQERHLAADEAAEAGEARYRFLAENAHDLITRHTVDGRIHYASPASSSLVGYRPEELIGRTLADLAHPDDVAIVSSAFKAAGEGKAATVELRLATRQGGYAWGEFRCRPAEHTGDAMGDIVAVTRDVAERKAHERELIQARDLAEDASRAKSRFLANMSHELRTPLNAILGFSEVMTHQMFGPIAARYVDYAQLIHESGGHLLGLINSILDMSKIEAGRFQLQPEPFDLAEVADQGLRFVRFVAERNGVTLEETIDPPARRIVADKRAVSQIMINLLSNGVKFTPRGGIVRIAATLVGDDVEISVADTGVGIDHADLNRLGQPFEQVDSEYTRTKEGTGLGLALVRALAHLHGGRMTIESLLGEGTTVRVRLPQAGAATQSPDVKHEMAAVE